MTLFEHALALAARGFKVFPIAPGAKQPPLLNGWPKKATSDPDEVRLLWMAVPNANVGIHCAGLAVIDVDPKKGGADSLELLRLTDDIPATLEARTPSGGQHLYFTLPDGHPGVANSVGALGAGLDVRSTGGYVVAPGSEIGGYTYQFVDETMHIAAIPEWLLVRLGKAAPKPDAPPEVVSAPIEVVKRAREWLIEQAPAIEGQGGDARTYAVACGLRDLGVSRAQALDLMLLWNDLCVPPWTPEDLAVKVGNAYRYAEGEPGARAARLEDFPVVEDSTQEFAAPEHKSQARNMRTLAEIATVETAGSGYAVKGLLQRASYAEVFGAPGEGKTFVALDLAYHVAAGLAWMSKKVHAGPVLYLAYEGQGGLAKRAKALRQKYGTEDVPLHVVSATFNLREKPGRQELGALIALLPTKPILIVVDTFARALMGGDENSAQDVGAFNSAVAALIESTGACVLIVHHSGKDKSRGARGSSALLGAIDTEIEVDQGQIIARKQRDVELGPPIGFKLVPLLVGVDEDGDDMTSCVVESAAVGPQSLTRISGNARRAFEVLCNKWPDNRPIDPQEWRDACADFLGPKSIAQRFYDVKKVLFSKGYIEEADRGWIRRKMT